MQHLLSPHEGDRATWCWWDSAFTTEELDILQNKAKQSQETSVVGPAEAPDASVRRSNISWMHKTNETAWVYDRLSYAISSINAKNFRFNLLGFDEPMQLSNYVYQNNGMYDWHMDIGSKDVVRKLSLVMQLSDPSEYEGGNLEIQIGSNRKVLEKKRGLITVFPSWVLHRVSPVLSGSRQSLVSWISGPPFI